MSQSFKLFRLQQIDSQLDQSRQRLEQIANIINNDARVREARAALEAAEAALQGAQKTLRHAEQDVQAQRIKIEQTEATLYGGRVSNTKELQDLQHESASLKKYLGVLEDRQLDIMIDYEEKEAAVKAASDGLEQTIGKVTEDQASLLGEQTNLNKDVERLEVERRAADASVPPEELALYDRLRIQRRGIAVSKIKDKACASCGSTLPPAIIQLAHNSNQLVLCTFCGRILYTD